MSKIWAILLILSLAIFGQTVFAQLENETTTAAPQPGLQGQRWVLSVGICKFADTRISQLRFCGKDAKSLADYFLADGVPEANVKLLLDEEATSANVISSLAQFKNKVGSNDTFFFAYSSHGAGDETNRTYFITFDTVVDNLANTAIPMQSIKQALENFGCLNVVFVVDTCHSEGSKSVQKYAPHLEEVQKLVQAANQKSRIAVLTSSRTHEYSIESPEYEHGIFTYYLLKGAAGEADNFPKDGQVSVTELFDYVMVAVPRETNRTQHPSGSFSYNWPRAKDQGCVLVGKIATSTSGLANDSGESMLKNTGLDSRDNTPVDKSNAELEKKLEVEPSPVNNTKPPEEKLDTPIADNDNPATKNHQEDKQLTTPDKTSETKASDQIESNDKTPTKVNKVPPVKPQDDEEDTTETKVATPTKANKVPQAKPQDDEEDVSSAEVKSSAQKNRTDKRIELTKGEDQVGTYRALVIANWKYKPSKNWTPLTTPFQNGKALVQSLVSSYGFPRSNVNYLKNGSLKQMTQALNELVSAAAAEDHIVICYFGHVDEEDGEGFWVPVDAKEKQGTKSMLAARQIRRCLVQLANKARHVLLISEPGLSGLVVPDDEDQPKKIKHKPSLKRAGKSCQMLMAASAEADEPYKQKLSVFTYLFVDALKKNTESDCTIADIVAIVNKGLKKLGQEPVQLLTLPGYQNESGFNFSHSSQSAETEEE